MSSDPSVPPDLPPDWLDRIARRPADGGPCGADWAASVPRLVAQALTRWHLTVTGPAWTGWTAVVFPVQRAGEPLVLKVVWPHPEAAAEHLALRHWAGRGAVRLVAADPAHGTLLLERLNAERDLYAVPVDEACEVIGTLLRRLHVAAPPTVPLLAEFVEEQVLALRTADGIPRRILARSRGLAAELVSDLEPARLRLLHTDLHFRNVLAGSRADRPPWLAIDPKPMAGHPGFELHPLLRNRVEDLGAGSDLRAGVRRRLAIVAEAAGVDPEEMRLWSIVHTGLQIGWAARDDDKAALSLQIAIFKALEN